MSPRCNTDLLYTHTYFMLENLPEYKVKQFYVENEMLTCAEGLFW